MQTKVLLFLTLRFSRANLKAEEHRSNEDVIFEIDEEDVLADDFGREKEMLERRKKSELWLHEKIHSRRTNTSCHSIPHQPASLLKMNQYLFPLDSL